MKQDDFFHSFPVVRGIQAGRVCYTAMIPFRLVDKIFQLNDDDLPPELRAQRTINKSRIPKITSYLVNNPKDYVIPTVTASISAKVSFEAVSDKGAGQNIGVLKVPMSAIVLINDGQHRRSAIEEAVKQNRELGHDHLSALLFVDEGLLRSQQVFSDLNRHASKPSASISTLYDHRCPISRMARTIQQEVKLFSRLTELEKSTVPNKSTHLFALNSIKQASLTLLSGASTSDFSGKEIDLAVAYWSNVAKNIPDWQLALEKKVTTSELRMNYIHAHSIALQALGTVGAEVLCLSETARNRYYKSLRSIDWSRRNSDWEGRAMNNGVMSKSKKNIILTSSYIKQKASLPLTPLERQAELALADAI